MSSVYDAADYILSKVGTVTTMKLQKLLYYSQAWALAWDETPLFENDFEAWANGPVCPEIFHAHKGLFSVSGDYFKKYCENPLTERQMSIIDSAIEYYGDKDPQWLSDLTHLERPWKETRAGVPSGAACNRVIEKTLMQEYYGGLQ